MPDPGDSSPGFDLPKEFLITWNMQGMLPVARLPAYGNCQKTFLRWFLYQAVSGHGGRHNMVYQQFIILHGALLRRMMHCKHLRAPALQWF